MTFGAAPSEPPGDDRQGGRHRERQRHRHQVRRSERLEAGGGHTSGAVAGHQVGVHLPDLVGREQFPEGRHVVLLDPVRHDLEEPGGGSSRLRKTFSPAPAPARWHPTHAER